MSKTDDFAPASSRNPATAKAATRAKEGIDSAGTTADRALGVASRNLDDVQRDAAPVLKQGVDETKQDIDDAVGFLEDSLQAARDKASEITDQVIEYTKDEPIKALLLAAAVGAGLMGLLGLLIRSRD